MPPLDVDAIAEAISQMVQAALKPVLADQQRLRAELVVLRVEHQQVQARVAALDVVADAPTPMARQTLQ